MTNDSKAPKYTPGPWYVSSYGPVTSIGWRIIAEDGSCIADILGTVHGELEPNKELIVATPELYESLIQMCEMWKSVCNAYGFDPDHMCQYTKANKLLERLS